MEMSKKTEEAINLMRERVPPDDVYLFLYFLTSRAELLLDELYATDGRLFCQLMEDENINKFSQNVFNLMLDCKTPFNSDEED